MCIRDSDLAMMLTLGGHTPPGGWIVTIADTVAATGTGVDKLVERIDAHSAYLRAGDGWAQRERAAILDEVQGFVRARIAAQVAHLFRADPDFDRLLDRLVRRDGDPVTAADGVTAAAARTLADGDQG